ncbi:hypothetical protein [Lysobacter capsici]
MNAYVPFVTGNRSRAMTRNAPELAQAKADGLHNIGEAPSSAG